MKRILILAANPRKDLNLRREIHSLKSVIERSQSKDKFEIKIGSGVSYEAIQRLFLEHKPSIVHFCGHGAGKDGLVFEDNENTEKLVSNEALAHLFNIFANQVECVLLNACYSNIQATEISHHINYVIGMKQAIRDDAAIVFARGFYEALGYGQSIEKAYKLGCNAIQIQLGNKDNFSLNSSEKERKIINTKLISKSLPEHLKPQLKIKSILTAFPDEEELTSSTTLPYLTELVQDEINRKKYREDIEADFNLGRNNVHRGKPLTQQEYRWRQVLLSKVKDSWIKGVLEKSLFNQVLFEQEITHHPDAVERPFSGFEEPVIEAEQSFEFIQASDIFEGMGAGRTLLILGEPGTGKTLSMLKLAERLIKKAEQNLSLQIPVVFNLSSWAVKRQKIADWLVEELKEKYQVSKALGKQWIEQEALILLLDGLDEVKADYRNDCVKALNQFLDDHGITETVVCCRVQDYKVLSERLKLRNAICIQPLSSEYINWYLDDVGKPLLGLKQLLQRDKELEEFARTPLIFSVMNITYQGYSLEKLLKEMSVKEKRYKKLFDKYIERMFKHRKIGLIKKYTQKLIIHYLTFLANSLQKEFQTIFFIERMQPSWLQLKSQNYLTKYYIFIGLIYGTIVAIVSLSGDIIDAQPIELNELLLAIAGVPLFGSILAYLMGRKIQPAEISPLNPLKKICNRIITDLRQSLPYLVENFPDFLNKLTREIIPFLVNLIQFLIQRFKATLKQEWFYWTVGFLSIFVAVVRAVSSPDKLVLNFLLGIIEGIIYGGILILFINTIFVPILYILYMGMGIFVSCFYGSLFLIGFLSYSLIKPEEIKVKTTPNQGTYQGFINSLIISSISGFLTTILGIIITFIASFAGAISNIIDSLYFILEKNISWKTLIKHTIEYTIHNSLSWRILDDFAIVGIAIGALISGRSCIQHFILRLILYRNGYIPWNYAKFLDYATERLFLQKVGGGYIFIHRMLMEHFAKMKLN